MKIFEKVPTDDNNYFVKLIVSPSDTMQLCTPNGNRQVNSITLLMRLRWKHEDLSLSAAKLVRCKPANVADSFSEQVLVEYETKQATSHNLMLGLQLQQGEAMIHVSVELAQAELEGCDMVTADERLLKNIHFYPIISLDSL